MDRLVLQGQGNQARRASDLFLNHLLEKETQDRFLAKSLIFVARKDVTVPPHGQRDLRGPTKSTEDVPDPAIDGWTAWRGVERHRRALQEDHRDHDGGVRPIFPSWPGLTRPSFWDPKATLVHTSSGSVMLV